MEFSAATGFFAFGLAVGAYDGAFSINSATATYTRGLPKLNFKPKSPWTPPPNPTTPVPWNPGNGTANPPDISTPSQRSTPSNRTGSTNQQPAPARDHRAEQVLANALTPTARPAATPAISAGVQAAIDAANALPVIDLGLLGGLADAGPSFVPEQAAAGSGLVEMSAQDRLEGACQTGSYLNSDVFGGVNRSAQMWQCGENPTWMRTNFNGQRVYQRDDLVNPYYVSPADRYGPSNLKRMQQGLAPMGPDGKPLNLHHMLQTQDGPIAEVTHSMHFGNYNQLHWKSGTDIPTGIDRDAFNAWKVKYWQFRATGF